MVSIHRPLGYGPSTLPLRHSALDTCGTKIQSHSYYSPRSFKIQKEKIAPKHKMSARQDYQHKVAEERNFEKGDKNNCACSNNFSTFFRPRHQPVCKNTFRLPAGVISGWRSRNVSQARTHSETRTLCDCISVLRLEITIMYSIHRDHRQN